MKLSALRSQSFLSYEVHFYTGKNGVLEELGSVGRYLSGPDGLVEFNLSIHTFDSVNASGQRITYKVEYDTIGLYYLDLKSRRFYQIDTFLLDHHVINSGRFREKQGGLPIQDTAIALDGDLLRNSLRDSTVDGLKVIVADFTDPVLDDGHHRKTTIIFRNDVPFFSIFGFTSYMKSEPSWVPIMFFHQDLTIKEAYLARIEKFESASKKAEQIFMAIRKAVGMHAEAGTQNTQVTLVMKK